MIMKVKAIRSVFMLMVGLHFLSCQSLSNCQDGYNYLSKAFSEKIDLLEKIAKENGGINGKGYRAAFFLEKLTKINSSISYGDVSFYESYSDFKNDRKKWTLWFRENKCVFTDEEIKKIEKTIIDETPWIGEPFQ
jgi:hypothetical protein